MRRNYCGVCNHHSRSSWLRWNSAGHSQKRRSQRNAIGSNSFGIECEWELGSVTAEFAIILPAVILILFAGIQVLGIQSSRVKLIGLAAESARAIARGEDQSKVDALVAERAIGSRALVEFLDLSVCVSIASDSKIGGLVEIPVIERACARKSGL